MKLTKVNILIIAVIVALFMSFGVMAQDDVDEIADLTVEIAGVLTFSGDDILVDGIVIAPAGAFNPSDYEDGDLVVVVGTLLEDDTIQVITLEIDVEDDEVDPIATEEPEVDATEEPTVDATEEPVIEATEEPTEELVYVHPVAKILADEFELDYELVMSWHDEDQLGYGNIGKALILADLLDADFEEMMQRVIDGEKPTQIAKAEGLSPSQLAPGRVISGRYVSNDEAESDGTVGYVSAGGSVNIRTEPNGDIIIAIQPGTEFIIIGTSDDGLWIEIQLYDGTTAWIFAELTAEGYAPEAVNTSTSDGGSSGDGLNKHGCEGRGNSCNAPGQNKGKNK